jgi:putative membrane protein
MRYIKYAILAAIAVCLVAVSLANRGNVTLQLLPNDLAEMVGLNQSIDLPLFVVIFGGIATGLLIGFIWEWIREYAQRAEAAEQRREMDRMRREIKRLKSKQSASESDVIMLLDEAS